jgi:hypothetical protein
MKDKNQSELNRRSILQSIAGGMAVGAGAPALGGTVSAGGKPVEADADVDMYRNKQEELRRQGVIHGDDDHPASRDVLTGRRLLEVLASEGLIDEPSLEALPSRRVSKKKTNTQRIRGSNHGFYHIEVNGHEEIGFLLDTPAGRLQVKFSQVSIPYAVLTPSDGGRPIEYVHTDGDTYESRPVSDELAAASDQDSSNSRSPGTDQIADDCEYWCYGCECEATLLCGHLNLLKCWNCYAGGCILTDNCVSCSP